jgi:hypothetical protein
MKSVQSKVHLRAAQEGVSQDTLFIFAIIAIIIR